MQSQQDLRKAMIKAHGKIRRVRMVGKRNHTLFGKFPCLFSDRRVVQSTDTKILFRANLKVEKVKLKTCFLTRQQKALLDCNVCSCKEPLAIKLLG